MSTYESSGRDRVRTTCPLAEYTSLRYPPPPSSLFCFFPGQFSPIRSTDCSPPVVVPRPRIPEFQALLAGPTTRVVRPIREPWSNSSTTDFSLTCVLSRSHESQGTFDDVNRSRCKRTSSQHTRRSAPRSYGQQSQDAGSRSHHRSIVIPFLLFRGWGLASIKLAVGGRRTATFGNPVSQCARPQF